MKTRLYKSFIPSLTNTLTGPLLSTPLDTDLTIRYVLSVRRIYPVRDGYPYLQGPVGVDYVYVPLLTSCLLIGHNLFVNLGSRVEDMNGKV